MGINRRLSKKKETAAQKYDYEHRSGPTKPNPILSTPWPTNHTFKLENEGREKEFIWNNGIEEALSRLKFHLFVTDDQEPLRFNSRDRGALAYLINWVDKELDK